MSELDKILMTVISIVSAGLAGYIVKQHLSRIEADKDHKDEIKKLTEDHKNEIKALNHAHNLEIREMSITIVTALTKMTGTLENWNRLTEKVLDRLTS